MKKQTSTIFSRFIKLIKVILLLLSLDFSQLTASASEGGNLHNHIVKMKNPIENGGVSTDVKQIQATLLGMLGLSDQPSPAQTTLIPQFMMDLYEKQMKAIQINNILKDYSEMHFGTVRSFLSEDSNSSLDISIQRFIFNISNIPHNEVISSAEVRLFLNNKDSNNHTYNIEVYEIIQPSADIEEPLTKLINAQTFNNRASSWSSFDISDTVTKWINSPGENHGILIQVKDIQDKKLIDHPVRLRRSIENEDQSWQVQQPFVVTYSDTDKVVHNRSKRRAKKNKNRKSKKRVHSRRKKRHEECSRHRLYVDFKEVGWNDWIVAPPGYQAYYCNGQCKFPLPEYLNATNHAIVQTLVHSVNPKAVPRPCCVPTELSPLSMLYLDDDKRLVLKNYQNMVVEGCGCR